MKLAIAALAAAIIMAAISAHAAVPDEVFGWEVLAQKQMGKTLKDADSAKYKNVHAFRFVSSSGEKAYVFCGLVNAKNSFGAYGGYQRFVATPVNVALERSMPDMDKLWRLLCNSANDVGAIAF